MRYALKLVTPPAVEPVTLGQAKDWCRIEPDVTELDDAITLVISAARKAAENRMHRKLITQTWLVVYDSFPVATSPLFAACLDIPLSPVQSVTAAYYDTNGVLKTLDPIAYEVDTFGVRPRLRPIWGTTWPVTSIRFGAAQFSVVAGYGPDAEAIPSNIRHWIKCAVVGMVNNPDLFAVLDGGETMSLGPFLDGLLDEYLIIEI